jgi:hypothetical protein
LKIVTSVDELLRLPRDRRINGMGPRQPIQLQIPSLSQHSQIRAQALLSRFQSRCGCAAGALVMLVSLVVGIMQVYDRNGVALSWPVLWESAVVLLAAFVIGFVAKMLTLAFTRWQFARECRVQYLKLTRLVGEGDNHVNLHAMGR